MPDPSRLRVAGFALTAAGALLAGIGSTLVWTTAGLRVDTQGVLDLEFRGVDLVEGIMALVVAVAALAGLVAMRRLHRNGRVRGAVALLIAGALLVALPAWVALRAEDRAVEEMARVVASTGGLSEQEAIQLVRTDPDLAVYAETSGLWLSIGGGLLVVIGSAVNLAWARHRDPLAAKS
ncbi:MAG TPA: Trp biosynthesis-associated membrane protein [Actinomycetota bacterium]|nr:Trp biosynthesis-associated membrane protein [Actinomycetota bacterium]